MVMDAHELAEVQRKWADNWPDDNATAGAIRGIIMRPPTRSTRWPTHDEFDL